MTNVEHWRNVWTRFMVSVKYILYDIWTFPSCIRRNILCSINLALSIVSCQLRRILNVSCHSPSHVRGWFILFSYWISFSRLRAGTITTSGCNVPQTSFVENLWIVLWEKTILWKMFLYIETHQTGSWNEYLGFVLAGKLIWFWLSWLIECRKMYPFLYMQCIGTLVFTITLAWDFLCTDVLSYLYMCMVF